MLTEKGSKLIPANLKKDVSLWGVTGTLEELNGQTKTVTPTTSQQTVTPDSGYNGITQVTVGAVDNTIDQNIVAGNIKDGVTILGVTGTLEEGVDTSDATAVANEIEKNKTAYVNGVKITGSLNVTNGMELHTNQATPAPGDRLVLSTQYGAGKTIISDNTSIGIGIFNSDLANTIGLTANKVKKNEVILGVTGTLESKDDLVQPRMLSNDDETDTQISLGTDEFAGKIFFNTNAENYYDASGDEYAFTEGLAKSNTLLSVIASQSALATAIGLTADKIKAGVTILGIEGTYNAPADAQQTFDTLNQVLPEAGDTYEGMGATEEEIEGVLDDILGNDVS